jgi:hypothetical protein
LSALKDTPLVPERTESMRVIYDKGSCVMGGERKFALMVMASLRAPPWSPCATLIKSYVCVCIKPPPPFYIILQRQLEKRFLNGDDLVQRVLET